MKKLFYEQALPLSLAVITALGLIGLLFLEILFLNHFLKEPITLQIRFPDVLIGMTIYVKTSIDFAIYIAQLMSVNRGWRSRIAIEIGTALGNAVGTFFIILIWAVFKEVKWLLALMILIAALVLFRLAEEGLERLHLKPKNIFNSLTNALIKILKPINSFFNPVLKYIVPEVGVGSVATRSFQALFIFAFTIPFILGLDDFAGYVPIFSIVNVFGFAAGVFIGHMILNIFLYISPKSTIVVVENTLIAFFGSIVFIVLGIWGIVEALKIFLVIFRI